VPDHHLIASEFALGRVLAVTRLSGGGPDVVKLTTTSGDWVIKPGINRTTAELYPRVASALNAAGLRQAVPRRTVAGAPVSVSRHMSPRYRALRSVLGHFLHIPVIRNGQIRAVRAPGDCNTHEVDSGQVGPVGGGGDDGDHESRGDQHRAQ